MAATSIRVARPEDAATLVAIRRDAILGLSTSHGREAAERWANAPHVTVERMQHVIRDGTVWIATRGDEELGWIEVRGATIQSLYVRDVASGSGIGSRLMDLGEDAISRAGHREADLEASPNAEPFYRNRGYLPTGEAIENGAIPMKKGLP